MKKIYLLLIITLAITFTSCQSFLEEDIYDFILRELEACSEDLPVRYTEGRDIGKATQGTALALKSTVALYAGRWDTASDAAKRVIDLKEYQLEPNYGDLYIKSKQDVSKEIIFQISFLAGTRNHSFPGGVNTRMAKGYSSKVPNQALIDSYLCVDGLPIDESPLYDPKKPFENRDPRMYETCVVPGMIFDGYQFESHKDSLLCWNYNGGQSRCYKPVCYIFRLLLEKIYRYGRSGVSEPE